MTYWDNTFQKIHDKLKKMKKAHSRTWLSIVHSETQKLRRHNPNVLYLRSVHCLLSHVIVEFPNSRHIYALRTYFLRCHGTLKRKSVAWHPENGCEVVYQWEVICLFSYLNWPLINLLFWTGAPYGPIISFLRHYMKMTFFWGHLFLIWACNGLDLGAEPPRIELPYLWTVRTL